MRGQNNIASFVLRFTQELWHDSQGEPHIQWRGHIRHVQGNEEGRFTDFAEAVAFIQRYLTQLTMKTVSGGQSLNQEKVLRESFKFWEQFASNYTGMMVEAMEHTVKQSQSFKDQLDQAAERALKAWHLPVQSDQVEIINKLNALQAQVEALTNHVAVLEKALQAKTGQPTEPSTDVHPKE
jgi:hypothetical protein